MADYYLEFEKPLKLIDEKIIEMETSDDPDAHAASEIVQNISFLIHPYVFVLILLSLTGVHQDHHLFPFQ